MLVISSEQLRQLGQSADELFLRQAAVRVAEHWPRRVERLGPLALEVRLRAVYVLAQDCGVRDRPDMLRLANVAMALDDNLGTDSPNTWVHETLNDTRLRPSDRLDVLDAQVRDWLLEKRARK